MVLRSLSYQWWYNPINWDVVEPRPCLQGEPTWWSHISYDISGFNWGVFSRSKSLFLFFCFFIFYFFFIMRPCYAKSISQFELWVWVLLYSLPLHGWYRVWKTQKVCVVISFFSCMSTRLELNNSTTLNLGLICYTLMIK